MIGQAPGRLEEEALDPHLPIVDAHHHLYNRPHKKYMFEDMLADIGAGHDVRATVYVETCAMSRADGPEALRPVGETEFANGVAAMSASGGYGSTRMCAAIVGHANLGLGERVGEVLDAHVAAASGRFRGIRHGAYWDADEAVFGHLTRRAPKGLLLDPVFRSGFKELGRRDLTFDAVLFHPQIPEVADLARAFPDTPIVVNHMGFPLGVGRYAGRRAEIFESWRRDMCALAACENVFVKLGGFGMTLLGFEFSSRPGTASSDELAKAWAPYCEVCIDTFGPSRCMFESNFPVDYATCTYSVIWNTFKKITGSHGEHDRRRLFAGTAAEFYRIALH